MTASWLNQLAPEHAPAPPSWWPPAPGWWCVAGLCLLAVLVLVGYRRFKRGSCPRARRAALAQLDRIRMQHEPDVGAEIQRLLRRYALAVFGADRVGRLTGKAWLDFLAQHGGEPLGGDRGRALLEAAYGNRRSPAEREAWLRAAAHFIRRAPRRRAGGGM